MSRSEAIRKKWQDPEYRAKLLKVRAQQGRERQGQTKSQSFENTLARFWAKVDKNGPIPTHRPELGPCWIWTGAVTHKGYGYFALNGKEVYAHRLANALAFGLLMTGQQVLHHCDNPPCCNPTHHFRGTNTDNMRDKMRKGRGRYDKITGKNSPMHGKTGDQSPAYVKLSQQQIEEIQNLYATREYSQKELAIKFGISVPTLRRRASLKFVKMENKSEKNLHEA